ncbi:MAG: glycosyltransferase family 87 protein [Oricola sp.]
MTETLRNGDWLQRDRLLAYPLLILGITVAATAYVLVANGGTLPNGSPFGSDFVSFWVAAREALAGRPEIPYLADRFAAAQNALFEDGNFYAFFYPPHYLAYMLPFGALPYYGALAAWAGLGFLAALAVITAIAGRRFETVLLTLAFPAAFLTVAHGQNAFLSAALFGGALVLLPGRPVLAGILFGLLTFKPQLGLLIPVALLADRQWRAIAAACAAAGLAGLVSVLLLGAGTWHLFLEQGAMAADTLREGLVGWNKMISSYAALRVSGVPHGAAMAAQAAISLAVAVVVAWSWRKRSGIASELRAALLLCGALVATPFGLNYDMFLLAPAIAFVAAHGMANGFAPWTKTVLAAVYISPFAVLWLMASMVPVAPLVTIGFFLHLAALAAASRVGAAEPVPAAE